MKKRKDGRYQISIFIGYREDGSQKRKVVYGATQSEVRQKANEIRMKQNMGMIIDSDITIAEWAVIWFETYKKGVSYNTMEMYRNVLKNHIVPKLGDIEVKDIKTAHIQQIINECFDSGLTKTLTNIKLTLSQLLEAAVMNDIIIKNPCKGVKVPQYEKRTKRALTQEEIEHIKSLDLDMSLKTFIYLLLYTGMRRGEALALTRDDIDLDAGSIRVNKTLIFVDNQSEIKDNPKTKAGIRTIPILKPIYPILKEYLASRDSYYLFTTSTGELITRSGFRRMWERFKKAYGETDITPHIFRHNFATTLYYAGVDMKSAQTILGHSSISITMDIYTHLDNERSDETALKLNNYFS